MASKKVCIVLTSAAFLGDHATGLWLEELSTPFYQFKEAGFEVVLASPKGGPCPIDAGSMSGDFFTESGRKFVQDPEAMGALSHSVALESVDLASVDALYLAGGHGTCVDFVGNSVLKGAVESLFSAGKVVAADCHGPIGLAECVKPDGTPLVAGLACTGFSDSEEAAVGLTGAVPFLIEARFKELGAEYQAADDWNSKCCVAGNLVTGQNPQSSEACASAVVELLTASS
eukprot:CAMPEP_0118969984 /NCGR_PEP_ID=MMETSP1173-20130426/6976_1 /TAXON_ID=1034831 /ORGANISM="Rhizochromulina marina cf, Strain CCMP1243" /LENGTH=229 /DNA_ID=CAMNT_0006919285 /DNA_START=71 /DNA_END=760 /DNA_ORIENTATION=+